MQDKVDMIWQEFFRKYGDSKDVLFSPESLYSIFKARLMDELAKELFERDGDV